MKAALNSIHYFAAHAKTKTHFAIGAYTIIKGMPDDEKGALLREFFLKYKYETSDKSCDFDTGFTDEMVEEIRSTYCWTLFEMIWKLVEKGLSEEAFYLELWNIIHTKLGIQDDKLYPVVLKACIYHPCVPYHYINLNDIVHIDKDTYAKCFKALEGNALSRLEALMDFPFEQETALAGELLKQLEKFPDIETKIVYLSFALSLAKNHYSEFPFFFESIDLDDTIDTSEQTE